MIKNIEKLLIRKERGIRSKENQLEYKKLYITAIVGALTFVVGLLWRDLMSATLSFFPEIPGFLGQVITTAIITALFITIIVILNKRMQSEQANLDKQKEGLDEQKIKAGQKVEFKKEKK